MASSGLPAILPTKLVMLRILSALTGLLCFNVFFLDSFDNRLNFVCVTRLDASMQFHTFLLDCQPQDKCVVVTPFGKCKHLRLQMGFLNSPSWAQAAMDELFSHLPDVEVHVDDTGMFLTNFEDHIETVDAVLQLPEQHDFSIKASKCHWCKSEAPWSGHIITSSGVLPNPDKIKPILRLQFPKTITKLRSFTGMVDFHQSFQKGRADLMAPLTALSG